MIFQRGEEAHRFSTRPPPPIPGQRSLAQAARAAAAPGWGRRAERAGRCDPRPWAACARKRPWQKGGGFGLHERCDINSSEGVSTSTRVGATSSTAWSAAPPHEAQREVSSLKDEFLFFLLLPCQCFVLFFPLHG